MNLLAVSINHHTASVELREALHLSKDEIKSYLDELKNGFFIEGFIISTCNRTEIYGLPINSNLSPLEIEKYLSDKNPNSKISEEHFQKFFSCSALRHLYSVASGIDSLLIGDNQILGQVKEAFQIAEEKQFAGFILKRIFDSAIRVGKRAKSETGISEGAVTISYAAVQLIEKIFSNLSKKSALVIGAGETGEIAAKHLRDKGIGKLTITNRTYSKAEKIAEDIHTKILPFDLFQESLHEFDIIISATSSPHLILTFDEINAAMKKRNYSAAVIMDIAVPRDIESSVKSIENVFYHDIDSLNIIVEQNLKRRKEEIPKVQKIVEEELVNFYNWFNSLEFAPTIKLLRDYFDNVRAEVVQKQINKFKIEDREKVDILTKQIINKLLHHPTAEIKKISESGIDSSDSKLKIALVRELFGTENKNIA